MDNLVELNQLNKDIELGKCLERLTNNSSDFKKLILDEYLKEYALSLIYNKCNANNNIDEINSKLDAIGFFFIYLQEIESKADTAKSLLEELNSNREL